MNPVIYLSNIYLNEKHKIWRREISLPAGPFDSLTKCMLNFIDFYRSHFDGATAAWLMLGKGPSFDRRHEYDLSQFNTVGINHVSRMMPVTLAHVIDIDVIEQSGADIERNARYVVMPWIPHVNMRPGARDLAGWVEHNPILAKLDREQRLLWYDLCTASVRHGKYDPVEVRYFSSEAVLCLLAMSGARKIRSLGIDGGANYSGEFQDLLTQTRLANGQASFDPQFAQIAKMITRYQLDYAPLDADAPVRVFIGSTPGEWLPAKVLEYSLKKHASLTVECYRLYESTIPIPTPRDAANRPRTPFSFQRFLIPQISGYKGRAIYLDSDMLVLKDIREVWQLPFEGADLLSISPCDERHRVTQYAVMLMDCQALGWRISELVAGLDRGEFTYESLMHDMAAAHRPAARIPGVWNTLDRYQAGVTALVHYTDMHKQPWLTLHNPVASLWISHLREAVDCGFISLEAVRNEVRKGHVRPSLLWQLQNGIDDPSLLREQAISLDMDFVPLHIIMAAAKGPTVMNQFKDRVLALFKGR